MWLVGTSSGRIQVGCKVMAGSHHLWAVPRMEGESFTVKNSGEFGSLQRDLNLFYMLTKKV